MITKTTQVKISTLNPHPKNVRQGDVGAISESLMTHGQYRPIVVQQSTNNILAGNHTWKAAQQLGWDKILVTYVDVDDDQAMRILLMDNRVNDLATYDDNALADLLQTLAATETEFQGTGFDGDDLDDLLFRLNGATALNDDTTKPSTENAYTQAVNIPQYNIVGEEPPIEKLFDDSRARELQKAIKQSDVPDEVKKFLTVASYRHIVFDYGKIAEYFPHQTKEIQDLMKQSVLVIIDIDDAAKLGYLKFDAVMNELENDDRE